MNTQELSLETRKVLWDIIRNLQIVIDNLDLSPEDERFFKQKIRELTDIRDKLMELQNAPAKETVLN